MMYLDHAAATPIHPQALKAMSPFLTKHFGNPSSIHKAGRETRAAIEQARTNIAQFLKRTPQEVIFTSGGTEANNWAIFGLAETHKNRGNHIISTLIEHDSILKPLQQLESRGFSVTYLKPDNQGLINPEELKKAVTAKTIFASIIYANNEIGTIQDIQKMAEILKKSKIPFHTDACQAVNYLPIPKNIDLITINSGKIYGPKGAGALIIKEKRNITPLFFGGGQEFRMRSGTENTSAIVGFGEAIKHIQPTSKTAKLRDQFIAELLKIPGTTLNGHPTKRLPNNVNISIEGLDQESLLVRLDMEGVYASAGSACSSGSIEPSHVLLAMKKEHAKNSIRFSLGKSTTKKELHTVAKKVTEIVEDMRG